MIDLIIGKEIKVTNGSDGLILHVKGPETEIGVKLHEDQVLYKWVAEAFSVICPMCSSREAILQRVEENFGYTPDDQAFENFNSMCRKLEAVCKDKYPETFELYYQKYYVEKA